MTAMPTLGPAAPDAARVPAPTLAARLKPLGADTAHRPPAAPHPPAEPDARAPRGLPGQGVLRRSPLARKIIVFNMLALVVLVAGVLYLNPFRDSLVLQREQGLVTEARLVANAFEAQIAVGRDRGGRGDPAGRDARGTGAAVGHDLRDVETWAAPDPHDSGAAVGDAPRDTGIAVGLDLRGTGPSRAAAPRLNADTAAPERGPSGRAATGSRPASRLPPPEDARRTLRAMDIGAGVNVFVFDPEGRVIASGEGRALPGRTLPGPGGLAGQHSTIITDLLASAWDRASGLLSPAAERAFRLDAESLARGVRDGAAAGATAVNTGRDPAGGTIFSVGTPIWSGGAVQGVVALTSAEGEIDALVRHEREQVLRMFVIAVLVSIGLSLVLASTIANPLSDLAVAAEAGRDRDPRRVAPGRVRIPDLKGRPDEIGRLSIAMRGMVAALYDRIDANEQFAADVAHEIKNPLASLRSAVGTMRVARRDDQRERLLGVIEHDVRRLDRLVSDISNASRLDSELVKEEEAEFDLLGTLRALCGHLGAQAAERGVDLVTDLPAGSVAIRGLEGRLAQVFVNLLGNAVSFCEAGDTVRLWARRREDRMLVVVEDTGPGIPEQALTKVFQRFYSERPVAEFGDHSGLGLAISRQIVEAHGGVIWAENIRPTSVDATSDPLGARFVVGLPL